MAELSKKNTPPHLVVWKRKLCCSTLLFITRILDVEIQIFDPMNKIDYSGNVDNASQYTTALGLAIRGLYK